jgi:DNA helicase HerA-like ATPase
VAYRHIDTNVVEHPGSERGALGRTISVDGSRAIIAVDPEAAREVIDRLSIGRLVAIASGASTVIGLIYAAASRPSASGEPQTQINVELVGEISESAAGAHWFDRGIRHYPPVGAPIRPVSSEDLGTIYSRKEDDRVVIGQLTQDPSINAEIRLRDLLQKHFAVLGTTGCGKSSAVTLLLKQIMEAAPSTRVLLIDPHNEYKHAFEDEAEVISPRNLNLPFWLFSFEELIDAIYRRRPGVEEETTMLAELIPLAKAKFAQKQDRTATLLKKDADDAGYTADSPVPYRISDILASIDEQLGKLDGKEDRPNLRRLKARIQAVTRDLRYQFMFSNKTIDDTMAHLIGTLFRIPTDGRPITILELAGFPAEVVDAVISVIGRMAFDLGVWGNGRVPVLVVCEEAHRYVPADMRLGFGPTRRAISRIAKEGRKYGVYLGIVTQRPAELDPTILSQCSTVFAMRMANEADHAIIRSAVSDAASSTLESLPSMGNREAIAFGEAVPMPMRVRFSSLSPDHLPRSRSQPLADTISDAESRVFVEEVVWRWRAVANRG